MRRFRLDRFARANGMTWEPGFAKPQLPGMIFSLGGDRKNSDLLRSTFPRFIEVANYTYETGSGKSRQTHRWGYVALKLETPLPHIVLDAVGNNGLFGSNLPVTFGRDQRLSLEGDFDQHFALYCPEGYERDALYLFTPDVMARFVDNAAALDVEIIDDWLFLYAKRDLSTVDPATWQWLFTTIDAIDEKFAQWARWRDDRLAAEVAASRNAGTAASGAPAPSVPLLTPPRRACRAGSATQARVSGVDGRGGRRRRRLVDPHDGVRALTRRGSVGGCRAHSAIRTTSATIRRIALRMRESLTLRNAPRARRAAHTPRSAQPQPGSAASLRMRESLTLRNAPRARRAAHTPRSAQPQPGSVATR